ncbi:MAG: hypothetical protein FD135_5204, partial [Comamonadaceae bacterium]
VITMGAGIGAGVGGGGAMGGKGVELHPARKAAMTAESLSVRVFKIGRWRDAVLMVFLGRFWGVNPVPVMCLKKAGLWLKIFLRR